MNDDGCLSIIAGCVIGLIAGCFIGSCFKQEEACAVRYEYTAKTELDTLRVAKDHDCTIPINLKPR